MSKKWIAIAVAAALIVVITAWLERWGPATAPETKAQGVELSLNGPAPGLSRPAKYAIAGFVFLALSVGLYFATRAWRTSNLFDRQYLFPPVGNVVPRLGGSKSGGCMATIQFESAPTKETVRLRTRGEMPLP